jgi:hypothetical protein
VGKWETRFPHYLPVNSFSSAVILTLATREHCFYISLGTKKVESLALRVLLDEHQSNHLHKGEGRKGERVGVGGRERERERETLPFVHLYWPLFAALRSN